MSKKNKGMVSEGKVGNKYPSLSFSVVRGGGVPPGFCHFRGNASQDHSLYATILVAITKQKLYLCK